MEKKVKLQKQKAYKYEDHAIFKYRLNIPSEMIRELGWDKEAEKKEGLELLIRLRDKKLEVTRSSA